MLKKGYLDTMRGAPLKVYNDTVDGGEYLFIFSSLNAIQEAGRKLDSQCLL
jgi:hypothetical protein